MYSPGGDPARSTTLRTMTSAATTAKAPIQRRRCSRPASGSGSPTSCGDEVLEQPACPGTLEVQLLRVALHADNEPPPRVLHRFDEAVVRACADDEITSEVAHGLVMHAVHVDSVVAGDRAQARCRRHLDVVRDLAARARGIVVVLGREHGADVL